MDSEELKSTAAKLKSENPGKAIRVICSSQIAPLFREVEHLGYRDTDGTALFPYAGILWAFAKDISADEMFVYTRGLPC